MHMGHAFTTVGTVVNDNTKTGGEFVFLGDVGGC